MKISDEELKSAYRRYLSSRRCESGPACSRLAETAGIFDPGLSRRRKYRRVAHAASCPSCAELFDILLDLERKRLPTSESPSISSLHSEESVSFLGWLGRFMLSWKGLAATAGFLVIGIFLIYWQAFPDLSRSSKQNSIELLRPKGSVSLGHPILFEWSTTIDVVEYEIRIFDNSLRLVWHQSNLIKAEAFLPYEISFAFIQKQPYFWTVTARLQSGGRIESKIGRFLVQ